MSQIVFTRARLIPLLLLVLPFVGAILSYFIAVHLNHVKPFFPFVSHAAAYPPQSALFSGFIEITGILGILTSILRYVVVKQKNSPVKQNTIDNLNAIALCFGCLAYIALIYLALNPVGFPSRDKQDYIWNVGVTHHVGAFGSLFCFDIYLFIQLYLTNHQNNTHKRTAVVHRFLAVSALTFSAIIVMIFYFALQDLLVAIADKETGIFAIPNFQYPFFPQLTALLEWTFLTFLFVFLATFSTDFKYITIVVRLQPKLVTSTGPAISLPHAVSANGHGARNGFHTFTRDGKEKKKQ